VKLWIEEWRETGVKVPLWYLLALLVKMVSLLLSQWTTNGRLLRGIVVRNGISAMGSMEATM
jgi:hypothetical protein